MSYNLETDVITDARSRPPAIVVYGDSGIGKSTFASTALKPIMLDLEKGSAYLDVPKVMPETFNDVLGWLDTILTGKHEYKTVVIDTLDWLEGLIHKQVCKDTGAKDILDNRNDGTAYGRCHVQALNLFLQVRDKLNLIRDQRGMAIILLAHTIKKRIDDPLDGSYDKHVIKLHEKIAAATVEWADAVLLAKKKLIQSGDRLIESGAVLVTSGSLGATAKNRLNLPAEIPFSWDGFISAINTNQHKGV
jgi:hypothetical protein